jgi:hypothetical protein
MPRTPAVIILIDPNEAIYAAYSLHPVTPSINIRQLALYRKNPKTKNGIDDFKYFIWPNLI